MYKEVLALHRPGSLKERWANRINWRRIGEKTARTSKASCRRGRDIVVQSVEEASKILVFTPSTVTPPGS